MSTPAVYHVYRHIRPDTNMPFYIGISCTDDNRCYHKRRNNLWTKIVQKNSGVFNVDILVEGLNESEALIKEAEFIELYGRIINGTGTLANILSQGSRKPQNKLSNDTYELLRQRMMGNSFALGYKCTLEQSKKRSLTRTGKPKKKGYILSQNTKSKMSESHKGNTATLGYVWITNGNSKKRIPSDSIIPEGWTKGLKLNNNNLITNLL